MLSCHFRYLNLILVNNESHNEFSISIILKFWIEICWFHANCLHDLFFLLFFFFLNLVLPTVLVKGNDGCGDVCLLTFVVLKVPVINVAGELVLEILVGVIYSACLVLVVLK